MTERYTGGMHGGSTVTTHGVWSTIVSVKGEPTSGTIELRPDARTGAVAIPRYYYCDGGRALFVSDASGNWLALNSPARGILQRVIPAPERRFGPLTEANNGATINGEVGDVFLVQLQATTSAGSLHAWNMSAPPSETLVLTNHVGSGNVSLFWLRASAAGTAHLRFVNAANPNSVVTFTFVIEETRPLPSQSD